MKILEEISAVQLPTDEKLASEGIVEFEKMIASLPQDLGEKVRNDEDLFKAYCGIFPELGGLSGCLLNRSTITPEQAAILIEAINSNGWAKVIRHAHRGHSIVNLKAATRVIRSNPAYFPEEALLDPAVWLISNPSQWYGWYAGAMQYILEIRYGLLSGYPLNACLKEFEYYQVRKRLMDSMLPGETTEEAVFINNFLRLGKDPAPEELARFSEILRNKGRGLFTEDEISLWVKTHGVGVCIGFVGFDESDDAWALAVDELYWKIKATVSFTVQAIL